MPPRLITIQFSTSSAPFQNGDGTVNLTEVARVLFQAKNAIHAEVGYAGGKSIPVCSLSLDDSEGTYIGTVRVDHE